MGFFKKLFTAVINAGANFTPDFGKTEYENWLEFLSRGGTTDEWKTLKRLNNWNFREDAISVYTKYQNELKPVSDKYYALMAKIERNWSVLYNSKNYTGRLAVAFEKDCLDDIAYYKKMYEIDSKYDKKSPPNVPAYRRLAMLYEKQERFEEAVTVCKEALLYGIDKRSRMLRMIKKAGRSPSAEEEAALKSFEERFATD